MQRALERHDAGTARVIPVILRPVDLYETPFTHLQCLPRDKIGQTLIDAEQIRRFLIYARGMKL